MFDQVGMQKTSKTLSYLVPIYRFPGVVVCKHWRHLFHCPDDDPIQRRGRLFFGKMLIYLHDRLHQRYLCRRCIDVVTASLSMMGRQVSLGNHSMGEENSRYESSCCMR